MRVAAWMCTTVVLLLAVTLTAQDSPAVTAHVSAARSLAGTEWAKAADFSPRRSG